MRTESVLRRRCEAIVYKEYREGDVSLRSKSVEQGLDVQCVMVVRLVRCNSASEGPRVSVSRNA